MTVSTGILHLEHSLWNYNTIISVVIHIKANTTCDPCAQNTNHKNYISCSCFHSVYRLLPFPLQLSYTLITVTWQPLHNYP